MKALSLWQPWASLWLTDQKIHETRHWSTRHRGWLLVHAAKRFERDFAWQDPFAELLDSEFGPHWGMELPTGALLGVVRLVSVVPTTNDRDETAHASDDDLLCGNWAPGRFAWRRDSVHVFAEPIPYRGAQGLFNVSDAVVEAALRALEAGDRREG